MVCHIQDQMNKMVDDILMEAEKKQAEQDDEEDKGDESVRRNFEEEEMKETRYENT